MKFVIQRVKHASVSVNGVVIGKIGRGLMVLVGIADSDTRELADRMLKKLIGLRIFEDAQGKTNLDLSQVEGQLLLISQFTLYADCHHGNRPSFIGAGKPDMAKPLMDDIIAAARRQVPVVEEGSFGADMQVELCNDGPFTIVLDSDEIFPAGK